MNCLIHVLLVVSTVVTMVTSVCQVDTLFLIDSSGSVSAEFDLMRNYITGLADIFNFG